MTECSGWCDKKVEDPEVAGWASIKLGSSEKIMGWLCRECVAKLDGDEDVKLERKPPHLSYSELREEFIAEGKIRP